MEQTFSVGLQEKGMRLDKWLCTKLPGLSRSRIKSILDTGGVRVNGRRVIIAGWELRAKDSVKVKVLDGKGTPRSSRRHLKIYYEDRDIIVVEKPAGIISIPNEGGIAGDSMLSEIKNYLARRLGKGSSSFVAAVHRLDAETSGIMVFALSNAGKRIEEQFKNHTIHREYVAIVLGRIEEESGRIDADLKKGDFHGGKKAMPVKSGSGKKAITEFRVKERYGNATLLAVTVRTGRTHQIRAHFYEKGFPIIGDKIYGDKEGPAKIPFGRHALHAHTIKFRHPTTGKQMDFSSALPKDMQELVDRLREEY